MKPKLPEKLWQVQWHLLFIGLAIVGVALWPLAQLLPALKGSFVMVIYFAAAIGVLAMLLLAAFVSALLSAGERLAILLVTFPVPIPVATPPTFTPEAFRCWSTAICPFLSDVRYPSFIDLLSASSRERLALSCMERVH